MNVHERISRTKQMLAADPEAFGLDSLDLDRDEPRLGCASTGQLITELRARLPEHDTALGFLRDALTGAQLAYRTVDS